MSSEVIWERSIDSEAIDRRRQRFIKGFGGFALLSLILGLLFTGPANTIGIAIVLVGVGGFIGSWVHYSGLNEQANPTISLIDGELVVGNRSVAVDDIRIFTTFATSVQMSLLGRFSRLNIGKALFRIDPAPAGGKKREPEIVEFGWPKMDAEGIATVEAALKEAVPDRWVPPGDLIDDDELPPPRRPSRRQS